MRMLKIKHPSSHREQHGSLLMRSMWIQECLALVSSFKVPTDMTTTGYCPEAKRILCDPDETYFKITHVSCSGSQRAPRAAARSLSSEKDLLPPQVHDGMCHRGLLREQAFHSLAEGLPRQRLSRPRVNYRHGSVFSLWLLPSTPAGHPPGCQSNGMCQAHCGRWETAEDCRMHIAEALSVGHYTHIRTNHQHVTLDL